MSGLDLLEDGFPHGTLEGARRGCKSRGACSGAMKCVDVVQRYAADWGFKKAIDAGETVEAILAREEAAGAGVEARDKAAQAGLAQDQRRAMLARLHAQGLTDAEIAREMQLEVRSVSNTRRKMGLAVNRVQRQAKLQRVRREAEHGTVSRYRKKCRCEACVAAQRAYQAEWRVRQGRTPQKEISARVDAVREQIREMNGRGMTDTAIAAELGKSKAWVNRMRSAMGLPNRFVQKGIPRPHRRKNAATAPDAQERRAAA